MLTSRISRYAFQALDRKFDSTLRHTLGGLVLPITLIFFAKIGLWFVTYDLRFFNVDAYVPIALAFLSITLHWSSMVNRRNLESNRSYGDWNGGIHQRQHRHSTHPIQF